MGVYLHIFIFGWGVRNRIVSDKSDFSLPTTARTMAFALSLRPTSAFVSVTVAAKLQVHCTSSFSFPRVPSLRRRSREAGYDRNRAVGQDFLGDFGARDPFPAEIESNFGEKVVGDFGTEHKILIPTLSALSLAQLTCEPVRASQPPMSIEEAEKLLKKVVGWRLVEGDEGTRIECLWKVRDYGCGIELINRIYRVADAAGHYPNLHLEQPNQVKAELWTASIGGLSLNDFIMAAKIDEIKTLDLLPKKRIWA